MGKVYVSARSTRFSTLSMTHLNDTFTSKQASRSDDVAKDIINKVIVIDVALPCSDEIKISFLSGEDYVEFATFHASNDDITPSKQP